jgi:hypothetical protein
MDDYDIVNRVLILKRDGENLQLPTIEYFACFAPKFIPSRTYLQFRVSNFDKATGELWLKYESSNWDERAFQISTEVNSQTLLSLDIKKVNIINKYSNTYANQTSFNADINLEDRWKASDNALKGSVPLKNDSEGIAGISNDYTIDDSFNLSFNEIKFQEGRITFTRHIHAIKKSIEFEILNVILKKEYDAIKNYFAKAIGTKKIQIDIKIEISGTNIKNKLATSVQISQISQDLLEQVENYVFENEFLLSDEGVFTPSNKLEELAKIFGKEEIKDTSWLLDKLVTKDRTKHYFHLRFLSSKHLAELCSLRLTGQPLSFIFLMKSNNNYFVVWETYKTEEATYIWKMINNDTKVILYEVEKLVEKIKWLRNNNKLNYLKAKPTNFKRIEHEYSGDDFGFNKWKTQLEDFLLA